ncbi:Double-stranded RNA-binding protein 4 [Bienertia sinuspersici]
MFKNKLQEYTQKWGLEFPAYRTSNEGFPHAPKFRSTVFVDGDPKSNKLILNEYAYKQHLGKPTYKTYPSDGPLPVFVSTVTVAGKSFTGDGGKSKKDAEQFAALAALRSLLGTDSGAVLNQMLRLKRDCNPRKRVNVTGYNQKKPKFTGHEAVSEHRTSNIISSLVYCCNISAQLFEMA